MGLLLFLALLIDYTEDVERHLIAVANQHRQRRGLAPLREDDSLTRQARRHSEKMLDGGFFSHVTPEGQSVRSRYGLGSRDDLRMVGENIWKGSGFDLGSARMAEEILNDWMRSPGHRQNILSREFTHLGIGIAKEGREIRATLGLALLDGRAPVRVLPRAKMRAIPRP